MGTDVEFRDMTNPPADSLLHNVPRMATWPFVNALGQRMLAAAREGEWELALQVMSKRNIVIERFFEVPVVEEESDRVADAIRETLEQDAELKRLSIAGRSDLQEKLRGLKAGRKARRAYVSGP